MKRTALVLAGVLALGAVSAMPARADFHGFCSAPRGTSNDLTVVSGALFQFTGTVSCGGAKKLTINSMSLKPIPKGKPAIPAPLNTCKNCATVSTSGFAPALDGTYQLDMTFTVVVQGRTIKHDRVARYSYAKGQVTKICPTGAAESC
jgi:hypothetical protein